MRWITVQRVLGVSVHELNGALEDASRHWHQGFRPVADQLIRPESELPAHNFAHSRLLPRPISRLTLDVPRPWPQPLLNDS